jgi:hypothetical protein
MYFIDNVRWSMMILVVSMHAADTYSPLGNWYYTDRSPISTGTLIAFAAWQMYLQSFFMGLLFFIAGYFVPASLDRKGRWQFIRDRAFRLGWPVLFYMFVLGPIVEYFLAHSWTSTRPTSFLNEWIKHIRNGEFLQENGPLWFCLALLIFSTLYAVVVRGRKGAQIDGHEPANPPRLGALILFSAAIATITFLVRLAPHSGGVYLNMHLGDFPQYVLLFAAGIFASRQQWPPKLSLRVGKQWLIVVLPVGFAVWLTILIIGGALEGHHKASGGWHWQSAAMNVWVCSQQSAV